MISSTFNTRNNTFEVVLDNGTKVSGTFKIIIVRSNCFCALNFQAECNKHEPSADSALEEKINFMAAQNEIQKKISEFAFDRIKFDFPNVEEHDDEKDENQKK